jgi:hypothetical protein
MAATTLLGAPPEAISVYPFTVGLDEKSRSDYLDACIVETKAELKGALKIKERIYIPSISRLGELKTLLTKLETMRELNHLANLLNRPECWLGPGDMSLVDPTVTKRIWILSKTNGLELLAFTGSAIPGGQGVFKIECLLSNCREGGTDILLTGSHFYLLEFEVPLTEDILTHAHQLLSNQD